MATIAALSVNIANAADDDIIFAAKNFWDNYGAVAISGTLTGDGIAYKNNTHSIWCIEERKECLITSIEQIGDKQIGSLAYPYSIPVMKWTDYEVVAAEDPGLFACSRTTITISRKSQTALWVQEPINQTKPACKKSDTKIYKWTIEDSPGWIRVMRK